jgi:hypothetical protein
MPRVARYRVAPERDGTFREPSVVSIRKSSNKLSRTDDGEFGLGLNPPEDDQHFVSRKVEFRTQYLFVFRDNPVIEPSPHCATSEPFDDLPGGTMRTQKPGYQHVRVEDRDPRPVAHEGRFRSRRAAATRSTTTPAVPTPFPRSTSACRSKLTICSAL